MTLKTPVNPVDAVIIGAGFSGLYMLHRLRELGCKTRLFDAADGVGGTWYWNRYPGARCDSESHYYCYSFSESIRNEWKWSCRYPSQPEILKYLNFVADRLDLMKDIELGVRMVGGSYDEKARHWIVETDKGEVVHTRFLITGVGNTSTPASPAIPELEHFSGDIYHTARWPHEKVDFSGKKVGIVGTGSSGIQSIPVIAKEAGRLTVFQRTANYSVPARNHDLTDAMREEQNESFEEWRKLVLASPIGMPFELPTVSALEESPEQQKARLEKLWEIGGFRFMFTSYTDITLDRDANAVVANFIAEKIREKVKDPHTADILCEFNHPVGTKRPPIDTDYYETFNRDNVFIESLRSNPIKQATTDGLLMANGAYHELDALVFATGFDTVTGTILKLNLRGRSGQLLSDKWRDGPRAYLGICSEGFPNLFMITGPGSPAILTNFPGCIEQHVDWITDVIKKMRDTDSIEFEATATAESEWLERIAADVEGNLLTTVDSWYMNSNLPGKPRVFTPFLSGMPAYTEICENVANSGYQGFEFKGS